MLCKHQFKCFVSMFWGTGEGGSVQRWRMSDACRRLEEMPPLPAARFGKIEFPNITQLLPAGPDCVLACSSTGSIALWDHARSSLPFLCTLQSRTADTSEKMYLLGAMDGRIRVMTQRLSAKVVLSWSAGGSFWWHGSTARTACATCTCCRRRPRWRPGRAAAWCGPRWQPRARRRPGRMSAAPGAWCTFCWRAMRSAWDPLQPSRHAGSSAFPLNTLIGSDVLALYVAEHYPEPV